jgi:electron transport complex protein RnfC
MRNLFRGGIHPDDNKLATAKKPIFQAPVPAKLIIPVRQHIGAPCAPVVKVGDLVKKGQIIADTQAFVSAPIHASSSGKIIEIANYPHPVFGTCQAIVIETDGQDEWLEGLPLERDWKSLESKAMIGLIRAAGIVGMGGATFPAHVKFSPPPDKPIDTLILNGSECEPYLTSDHRVMLEMAEKIIDGMHIGMKVLNVTKGFIGIEENKPDAIAQFQKLLEGSDITVVPLPTKYPQGAEKNLIIAITGREVPSGALPMEVGVVVENTGTAVAVADAVIRGIPLIERVTTVTGSCIANPQNLLVRVGTTFAEAIATCGGFTTEPAKLIMGGPMMGMAQQTADVPIIKGTSGIVALSATEIHDGIERPCIRCGRCVKACPMGLVPSVFSVLGERKLYEQAKTEHNLLDCVECGSCVYVCPAKRKIVQYVKLSKAQLAAAAKK